MFRRAGLPPWLLPSLVASMLLAITAVAGLLLLPRSELPRLGTLPPFSLTDQEGRSVQNRTYEDKALLVSFIFTHCTDICPVVTAQMRLLQDHLRETGQLGRDALLLSISVDPQRDTPETLKAYGAQFGADFSHWHFLTGETEQVRALVVGGFKTGMEQIDHATDHSSDHSHNTNLPSGYDIMHSGRIVLVDSGGIRAYYDSTALDIKQISSDLKQLR